MTTLYVPLHLPAPQAQRFLERELRYREVDHVEIRDNLMVIEHRRREIHEYSVQDIRDIFSMTDTPTVV